MAENQNKALKPCPFCGGEADLELLLLYKNGPPMAWPRCRKCNAEINDLFSTAEEAIIAWNRRTDHREDSV